MKTVRNILIIVAVFAVFASCRKDCYMPTRSLLGIAFIDSATVKPVTVNGVTVKGVGSDSILYDSVNVSKVYLPLHITKDTTEFQFKVAAIGDFKEGVEFTLKVVHSTSPQFVNPECGCVPFQVIKKFEFSMPKLFKKVELYNSEIQNIEQDVHIKVYL
ncbi:MAG: DUF6452 family protein [Paludibacteraceae bacterium]|nr:DUF6452 family protein [Paludibacteraceae bacterium]